MKNLFINRDLSNYIKKAFKRTPGLTILGARQSGKTTLAKKLFPKFKYVPLDAPDVKLQAEEDPRGFLKQYSTNTILDEIHKTPKLLDYLRNYLDKTDKPGQYILTGSNNFLMLDNISQSLSGRVIIVELLPFSLKELNKTKFRMDNYNDYIFKGFYPRIYKMNQSPDEYYRSYIKTYIERDVRQLKNIKNLAQFTKFIKICAGQIGGIIDYNYIGSRVGIDDKTVKSWLGILEASYIIFLLKPYFKNYNKRIVKRPKLYFYDTGLACHLLSIQDSKYIKIDRMGGWLFENLIISEIMKNFYNEGKTPPLYYWRTHQGKEIDCLIDLGLQKIPVEIKESNTINKKFLDNLKYWNKITGTKLSNSYIIYGGSQIKIWQGINILPWTEVIHLNKKITNKLKKFIK